MSVKPYRHRRFRLARWFFAQVPVGREWLEVMIHNADGFGCMTDHEAIRLRDFLLRHWPLEEFPRRDP